MRHDECVRQIALLLLPVVAANYWREPPKRKKQRRYPFTSDWIDVLPSTWAFKIMRLPDTTVRKPTARFCVRGQLVGTRHRLLRQPRQSPDEQPRAATSSHEQPWTSSHEQPRAATSSHEQPRAAMDKQPPSSESTRLPVFTLQPATNGVTHCFKDAS
jgi:hypothetical protein